MYKLLFTPLGKDVGIGVKSVGVCISMGSETPGKVWKFGVGRREVL
jgi:hypothetical protein